MSKDIYTNFSNAQSQLQLITRLASRENFQNRQDLQNYLDELTPNDNLDSYSILLPDGTLLQKNDHIKINTPPQDYDMLLKKGTFIRKRRKTPVFRHGDIRRVHLICVSN